MKTFGIVLAVLPLLAIAAPSQSSDRDDSTSNTQYDVGHTMRSRGVDQGDRLQLSALDTGRENKDDNVGVPDITHNHATDQHGNPNITRFEEARENEVEELLKRDYEVRDIEARDKIDHCKIFSPYHNRVGR